MKTLSFMVALLCAVLIHGTSDASQRKTKHHAVRIPTPPTKVNHPSGPVRSAIVVNQRVQHQNVTNSNTSPPRIVMRHRGSNPAVIGGSATSNAKNTAAISGTRMNRRHY